MGQEVRGRSDRTTPHTHTVYPSSVSVVKKRPVLMEILSLLVCFRLIESTLTRSSAQSLADVCANVGLLPVTVLSDVVY